MFASSGRWAIAEFGGTGGRADWRGEVQKGAGELGRWRPVVLERLGMLWFWSLGVALGAVG